MHRQAKRSSALLLGLAFWLSCVALSAAESWPEALAEMPLGTNVTQLDRSNCIEIMLGSYTSNAVVKALIFMPGATDEFYMFHRACARLTNKEPTLLDAVQALTNQTLIRATFLPPLLLLHTDEDPLEPSNHIEHAATAEKFKRAKFPSMLCNDDDWQVLQPIIKKTFHMDVRPWRYSMDSWHFYRHSFAESGLTGWQGLEAVSLAGKTTFTVTRGRLIFEGDERVRSVPKVESSPPRP